MVYTLQNVLDLARSLLLDNVLVPTGQNWQNNVLIPFVATPYRRMWNCMVGTSKHAQGTAYINVPPLTTMIIPSTYGITDFAEPIWIEQRLPGTVINITSTDTSTPINVTVASTSGISATQELIISGVAGTMAPWGLWYPTVVNGTQLSLNGSGSDGLAGTSGTMTLQGTYIWTRIPQQDDLSDGTPQQWISGYLWEREQIQITPVTSTMQLKITYYISGTAPTNPNAVLNITNCPIDFLAAATAANAANAQGWYDRAQILFTDAYGPQGQANGSGGMLGEFIKPQVLGNQAVQRRPGSFRPKRSRYGAFWF